MTISEELANLHALHQQGAITADEFLQAKGHLLTQLPPSTDGAPQQETPATREPTRATRKPRALLVAAVVALLCVGGGAAYVAQERAEREQAEDTYDYYDYGPAVEQLCNDHPQLCNR